jgi:hypothetical protein
MDRCRRENPMLMNVAPGHHVACWLHDTALFGEAA